MKRNSLLKQQLNQKMSLFVDLRKVEMPPTGWIKAIRNALGMSLEQLGDKLSVSKQAVHDIEAREKVGSITIKSLREVANAMDMELVYGMVPKDGTLDALITRKAKALAYEIVMRANQTMKLEEQENSYERIQKAIEERTEVLKNEMPKVLWD